LVALICAGAGVAHLLAGRVRIEAPRLGTGIRVAILALGLVLVAAALVVADPGRRFEEFSRQSPELADPSLQAHLLSAGGRGRWQMWEAAVDEFRSSPFLGGGAGSYEAWWAEHRPILVFVRNAHSLYLETLAELGAVGLLLLAGFLLAALVSAARRLRSAEGEARSGVAALIAVFAVFLLEAAIDWVWEIPAVTGIALVAVGLATGGATAAGRLERREDRHRRRLRLSLRLAATLAALAVIALQALPLLAETKIDRSREAAARGDLQRAREDALAARALEPWASSPRVQLALVEEQVGHLDAARAAVTEAIERDREDWRLWLVKARLETKAGDVPAARKSLARAVALNPLSPLFRPGG
ncbi:MAG: O-antigen ligase family protein, partial [Actinomycetota bacterium]|nr:O-antigen ligase family protein [Actinomycetota bacterium]